MNAKIWGRWVTRLFQRRGQARRPLPGHRPLAFESLEDRVVPATFRWAGDGGNSFWSNANNWQRADGSPGVPAAGDDLVFDFLAAPANRNAIDDISTIPAGQGFSKITISASGYVLDATVPKIVLTGPIEVGAGVGTVRIVSDVQLAPPAATLQTTITVGSNGSHLVISGHHPRLDNPSQGVQQTLTKAGQGELELTNDNGGSSGFLGAIVLANNGGILTIANEHALGDGNTTTVNPNSQLQLKNFSAPVTESLIINGVGVAANGALLNASGNNTWAGTITLDG